MASSLAYRVMYIRKVSLYGFFTSLGAKPQRLCLTIVILDTHTKITSDESVHRLDTRGKRLKALKIS